MIIRYYNKIVCEYYLSQYHSINNYNNLNYFKNHKNATLLLITSEESFVHDMSKMTMLLLLLSFTNGNDINN